MLPNNPYTWHTHSMKNGTTQSSNNANECLSYANFEIVNKNDIDYIPYSVNNAVKNVNNYADFISKVSNTEIMFKGWGFDVGTLYGGSNASRIAVDGNYVYVVDDSTHKVYKSIDGGATWDRGTVYTHSLSYGAIGIATNNSNVYVLDYGETLKVFKSTDNGVTWDNGMAYGGTEGYSITADNNGLYIGDQSNIYKSIDNGATWFIVHAALSSLFVPFISSDKNGLLFILDAVARMIYKSIDGGATWSAGTSVPYYSLKGICATNNQVYIMDATKVYKTIDGGNTWSSGVSFGGTLAVSISTNNSSVYVLDYNNHKVYKSTQPPIQLTYSDLTTETFDILPNITGISGNGTYTVVLEKGTGIPIATTSTITESYSAPSSPVNGDYWLDISTDIATPYKRVSGAWVITQFVKLGEFTITTGTMSTPVSYATNGKYISPDTACVTAANTATTFTHNLGTQLYNSTLYLRCINTEAGYTAGQIIPAMTLLNNATPYSITPYIEVKNKNTTSFRSGAYTTSPYVGQSQSTGVQANLTPGNWKQFCITERNF